MNASAEFNNQIIDDLCKRHASCRVVNPRVDAAADARERAFEKATINGTRNIEIMDSMIERNRSEGRFTTSDDFAVMFRRRLSKERGGFEERRPFNVSPADDARSDTVEARQTFESTVTEAVKPSADVEVDYRLDEDFEPENVSDVVEIEKSQKGKLSLEKVKNDVAKFYSIICDLVDCDPKVLRVKKKRSAFPFVAFASVIIIAISLFLIVSSSVKLMEADREISELKSDISSIRKEEARLDSRLEEKNNLSEIERLARDRYGMIRSEYITAKFLPYGGFANGTVILYNTDEENNYQSELRGTLLSALGFGK